MALFDGENEQSDDDTTESDGWDVDEDRGSSSRAADGADSRAEQDSSSELETATVAADDPNGTLKRAVDPEAGVVIYAYKNGRAGGLSTVPLSQTDLTTADRS